MCVFPSGINHDKLQLTGRAGNDCRNYLNECLVSLEMSEGVIPVKRLNTLHILTNQPDSFYLLA